MRDLLGARSQQRIAELEVEVARLRGEVAAQAELLAARARLIEDQRIEISDLRRAVTDQQRQFVDLAGARALRSQTVDKPSPFPASPASLRPNGTNGNGHHSGSDEEPSVTRLNRRQRKERQQDAELVRHGLMSRDTFERLYGADEDESTE